MGKKQENTVQRLAGEFALFLKVHRDTVGHHAPVKSEELEAVFQITGGEVRAIAHALRTLPLPIGSGTDGYFWGDQEEIIGTIAHLKSRIASISEIVRDLSRWIEMDANLKLEMADRVDRGERYAELQRALAHIQYPPPSPGGDK